MQPRRFTVSVACLWLCGHLTFLMAAPLLLAHAPQAADALTCTCTHTGHVECPMHHPRDRNAKKRCECRGTTDPDAASVVALLGPIAVLADTPASLAPLPITNLPNHLISRFTGTVAAPDGLPPRA